MFPHRHIISVKDFHGFEKRIEMASSAGRKLEYKVTWFHELASQSYFVIIGGEEFHFSDDELAEAIEKYNEE